MNIFFFGNTSLAAQNLSNDLILKNNVYFFNRRKNTKNSFYFDLKKKRHKSFKHISIKKIDYLFYFSSHVPLNENKSDWKKCKNINIFGLVNLLENIKIPIKKIILASSCSVYGYEKEKIFREENILKPNNFYAISKSMQEKILQVYCIKKNIDFLCYRLGYVFGAGMNNNRLVKKIVKSIKKGDKINLFNLNLNLNLIHSEDISYIILKNFRKAKGIYNLTYPKKTTLEFFYKTLLDKELNKSLKKNNFTPDKLLKNFKNFKNFKIKNLKEKIIKFKNEN